MSKSVFKRLAERFSECQDDIMKGKKASNTIEPLLSKAGQALFEAISSREIELKDAPDSFVYVPNKRTGSGDKRKALNIYWLNALYWICVNRRGSFPDWGGNSAAEFLWTVEFHADRSVEDSIEKSILNLPSNVRARAFSAKGSGNRRQEDKAAIERVLLALASLSEDVCLYLAQILTSKPAETTLVPTEDADEVTNDVDTEGETFKIDLSGFNQSTSLNLLTDLLGDIKREGVTIDTDRHGKKHAKNLRDTLKEHQLGGVAAKIKVKKGKATLYIPPKRITVISRKEGE